MYCKALFMALATVLLAAPSALGQTDLRPSDRVVAVAELLAGLDGAHVDRFHSIDAAAFATEAARLQATAAGLSEAQFKTEITRLIASIGDGHTFINWDDLRALPLRLAGFNDGVYVVAAAPEHEGLVGARIDRVGGVSIEAAVARISSLVSADNAHQRASRVPVYLAHVDFLEGLGLADAGRVRIDVRLRSGEHRVIEIDSVTMREQLHGLNIVPAPLQQFLAADFDNALSFADMRPEAQGWPLYRRSHARSYWLLELPERGALYVNYRYVRSDGQPSPAAFADEVGRVARAHPDWRVIIDVRENPGGSFELSYPLVETLRGLDAERAPGWLVVLTSAKTFSAALGFTALMEMQTSAILIGAPTGGGANHYGNVRTVATPLLGHPLRVSTGFNAWGLSEDRRDTIAPHMAVTESSRQYFDGVDPLLETALLADSLRLGWRVSADTDDIDRSYAYGPGQILRLRCARSRCRITVTALVDTPALQEGRGRYRAWLRGLQLSGVSDDSAMLRLSGQTRRLSGVDPSALPFEELLARGALEEAQVRFSLERALNPQDARFSAGRLNRTAYQYLWRGLPETAVVILIAATGAYPDSANLHDSLGEALVSIGRSQEARVSYERAVQLDPDLASAVQALERLGASE
jgi:hypothetical protein